MFNAYAVPVDLKLKTQFCFDINHEHVIFFNEQIRLPLN